VCEIADGAHGADLIGTYFPAEGRALQTLSNQTGLIIPSLHELWDDSQLQVEALARFGPALYAPMIHRGKGVGVMLRLREQGAPLFTARDLEIAELVAGQATMAFELADAQHAEEMALLLGERNRIGRDLR
ncbi:histidine kinase, partial [Lactobacillus crispatus]|uniref:GAF domain-containing protein n=1 Tax=Lactobacillus crispatus TaxID=47770 RepID=UPI0010610B21